MATIEARNGKDGEVTYRARVRILGHPERTATFARRTDAKAWATQIEADLRRGRYVATTEAMRRTVAQLIDRYLEETLPHKARNRDRRSVERCLKWWRDEIGEIALANLTPAILTEKKLALRRGNTTRGTQRGPGTVNRYLAALGGCLKTAVLEYGWIEVTPMRNVQKFEEPRGRVRFLSDDERTRLLTVCKKHRDLYALVLLALSTGARKGELLGLKWQDVELSRNAIVLHDTKNRDRRVLPLAGPALALMQERAKVRQIDNAYVFPGRKNGQPWRSHEAWDDALEEAKIEDFRFHDLRHSAASYLAMNGATLAEIAEILGHRTLAMVKRYAHLSEQHVSKVVTRMNESVFGRLP
jgi:integrase